MVFQLMRVLKKSKFRMGGNKLPWEKSLVSRQVALRLRESDGSGERILSSVSSTLTKAMIG